MTARRPKTAWALAAAIILGACPGPEGPGPGNDAWSDLAPLGLGPRQETAVVNLAGEIIVLGGVNHLSQTLSTVEAYDPATDRWRTLADLPVTAHHAQAAVFDDRLYVLGFLQGLSFDPDPRGFVYDADADAWDPVADMPAPHDRGGGVALATSDGIYLVGGLSGNALPTVHRYDPAADSYTQLADLPDRTDHLVGGVIDDTMYIAGGRDRSIDAHRSNVYAYDAEGDAWNERAAMPTSRAGAAGAVVDGELFVLGGEGDADDPNGVFDDVEAYDPVTNSWRVIGPMARPRHGMGAAAAADGRIYVPGGADVRGFAAVDDHDALTP